MAQRPGPKPILDELDYVPLTIEDARSLYAALVGAGTRAQKARTIVGALQTLPERYPESLQVLMVGYRKDLQKIGPPPWKARKRRTDLRAVSSSGGLLAEVA